MLPIQKFINIKRDIKDCFLFAFYSKDSNKKLIERLENTIYLKYPKSITHYEKWYFKGMIDLLREQYESTHLEFCYEVDGILYSTYKDTTKLKLEDYEICYKSDTKCGLYYKDVKNVAYFSDLVNKKGV